MSVRIPDSSHVKQFPEAVQLFKSKNEPKGSLLRKEIEALKSSEQKGWQEAAVKLIRKSRFEDPQLEIARLKDAGVITKEVEPKMDQAVEVFSPNQNKMKAMLGRVLEIQTIYGSTHHVLVHAAAFRWLVYSDLVKELMKINHPEMDLHYYKFLRLPKETAEYGIEIYSKCPNVDDEEMQIRTDLISADAYFFNNRYEESALYFLGNNYNIMDSKEIIEKVSKEALCHFYPEMNVSDLKDYAKRISHAGKQSDLGNLFIFCIPKENSAKVQYRAHAFGVPCAHHKDGDDQKILDQLQEGQLQEETTCWKEIPPQFRIFTPALKKEENGVKIHLIASDRTARKEEKQEIQNLVREIHEKFGKVPVSSDQNVKV